MESMDGFTLAQILHQHMNPVVMVLSTPKAEESCQRNGLSFVDLFWTFCSLGNINVPMRTASEQPYRLTEFHIRMFYSSEICQPRPEVAEEFLLQVVNDSNDEVSTELDGKAQKVELTDLIAEAESRAPTFKKYTESSCEPWHFLSMKHLIIRLPILSSLSFGDTSHDYASESLATIGWNDHRDPLVHDKEEVDGLFNFLENYQNMPKTNL